MPRIDSIKLPGLRGGGSSAFAGENEEVSIVIEHGDVPGLYL
jgi:hypothetical protein